MQEVEIIYGYDRFDEKQQETLKYFYYTFMSRWRIEARASITPISFEVRDKKMVFNFYMWGTARYLYVINSNTWY
ncbi:MAG: hypothetical protein K9L62_12900 [Vallitaleaceae bacterium]|nr:hypothetical protein [Vallitaleaceae bacterium]